MQAITNTVRRNVFAIQISAEIFLRIILIPQIIEFKTNRTASNAIIKGWRNCVAKINLTTVLNCLKTLSTIQISSKVFVERMFCFKIIAKYNKKRLTLFAEITSGWNFCLQKFISVYHRKKI